MGFGVILGLRLRKFWVYRGNHSICFRGGGGPLGQQGPLKRRLQGLELGAVRVSGFRL